MEPMAQRPRRNRRTAGIRAAIRETTMGPEHLFYPLFVHAGSGCQPIASMPGCERLDLDGLVREAVAAHALGIPAIVLFPAIDGSLKDASGTESRNPDGLIPKCLARLKREIPELLLVTDVALDPYSSDGHDGIVSPDGRILNDETISVLVEQAIVQAQAGADIIAPSDMMDGRVGAIRRGLDGAGFTEVSILSYTAKYASAFYGPFRDALDSAPRFGDKKTYQMDPANAVEALRELALDEAEGADMVMVKPAGPYLDVIARIRQATTLPLAAYQVSGEYAMLQAAAAAGWLDGRRAVLESLLAIRRAGANIILTYFAKQAAGWLREDRGYVLAKDVIIPR